jgi:hypothetical protein
MPARALRPIDAKVQSQLEPIIPKSAGQQLAESSGPRPSTRFHPRADARSRGDGGLLRQNPATFDHHACARRVNHGTLEVLESAATFEFQHRGRSLLVRHPAYREAPQLRHLAADYRAFIVEGL